jgi:hypothetical protein
MSIGGFDEGFPGSAGRGRLLGAIKPSEGETHPNCNYDDDEAVIKVSFPILEKHSDRHLSSLCLLGYIYK